MCWEIASIALSAGASVLQGANAAAQSNAQAEILKRQAELAFDQGEIDAGAVQDKANQTIGQQIASAGGSGVTLQGSPTDAIGSTASDAALQQAAIHLNARVDSTIKIEQARMAKIAAQNQMTDGIIGGASELARGLTKVGNSYSTTSTSSSRTIRPGELW